jgi:hypothetical protein
VDIIAHYSFINLLIINSKKTNNGPRYSFIGVRLEKGKKGTISLTKGSRKKENRAGFASPYRKKASPSEKERKGYDEN